MQAKIAALLCGRLTTGIADPILALSLPRVPFTKSRPPVLGSSSLPGITSGATTDVTFIGKYIRVSHTLLGVLAFLQPSRRHRQLPWSASTISSNKAGSTSPQARQPTKKPFILRRILRDCGCAVVAACMYALFAYHVGTCAFSV